MAIYTYTIYYALYNIIYVYTHIHKKYILDIYIYILIYFKVPREIAINIKR